MANPIVTVNVSLQFGPTPSNFQGTGAFVSQGGTVTAPGTSSLLTQLADLTPILAGAKAISSATQSGGVATITTTTPHGFLIGEYLEITVAGMTPANYNGTYLCLITGASTFTFPVLGAPGAATVVGVYTLEDVAELLAMATTFFGQGSTTSVYVLELGPTDISAGVAALSAWITANPLTYYAFLVPRYWDANPAFLALAQAYSSPSSMTYFFVTTTLATYTAYTALMKSICACIEAPPTGKWPVNALTAASYTGAWPSNNLTALSWSAANGGVVTGSTTTPHGVHAGDQFTITGVTPAGYNGTFVALPGTSGSTLVYALASNPGTQTVLGALAGSTFGFVTATTASAHGVVAGQWFTIAGTTPGGYNGTFQALPGTTGSTLIYAVGANPGTQTVLGTLLPSYYASAALFPTEFSMAAIFWTWLQTAPNGNNRVAPFANRFLFGVTPFPTAGNSALLSRLKAANMNVVGTGAEGGISTALIQWGSFLDGRPMNYWYSVDWMQINIKLRVSNAIINGSNNPGNPLYNNQAGITAVEGVIADTVGSAIAFGLALGTVLQTQLGGRDYQSALSRGAFAGQAAINAIPFTEYYSNNPGHYALGIYNGYSVVYAPLRGFDHVTINLTVTDFVALP